MLDSLARFVYRRRRFVAVGAVVFFLVAAGIGSGVASHLDPYGADDPATDSVKADNLLTDQGYRPTSLIVLFQNAPVSRQWSMTCAHAVTSPRSRATTTLARATSSRTIATRPTLRWR